MLSVSIDKALKRLILTVAGKAQISDPSILFLLHEIVEYSKLRVKVLINIHLADIVEEIEIKVLHPCLFKLLLKYLFYLGHI